MENRFEVRRSKYGLFHYDGILMRALSLDEVAKLLNDHESLKKTLSQEPGD